jgi:hypothetical protein
MKYQEPAQGIMLQKDFGHSKNFKVECDCSSDDHAAHMWIELSDDKEMQCVEVSFYVHTWTPLWEGWGARLRAVYEILFKGVHKQEHHMILDKQSALNFAKTIIKNVKELENDNSKC